RKRPPTPFPALLYESPRLRTQRPVLSSAHFDDGGVIFQEPPSFTKLIGSDFVPVLTVPVALSPSTLTFSKVAEVTSLNCSAALGFFKATLKSFLPSSVLSSAALTPSSSAIFSSAIFRASAGNLSNILNCSGMALAIASILLWPSLDIRFQALS